MKNKKIMCPPNSLRIVFSRTAKIYLQCMRLWFCIPSVKVILRIILNYWHIYQKTHIFPLLFLNLRSLCIFSSFWPIKLSDPHKYIFVLNVGLCGFGNQLKWCWTIPWRMFLQAAVIEDYLLFDLGLIFFKNKINIFI